VLYMYDVSRLKRSSATSATEVESRLVDTESRRDSNADLPPIATRTTSATSQQQLRRTSYHGAIISVGIDGQQKATPRDEIRTTSAE